MTGRCCPNRSPAMSSTERCASCDAGAIHGLTGYSQRKDIIGSTRVARRAGR
jgi:hypothetical protein